MIGIKDIFAASKRIYPIARVTPLFSSHSFNAMNRFDVYLKAENLQKTGSFKIRGAANFILKRQIEHGKISGIITASSGNHGQAVACVAGQLGIPAIVVMPEWAVAAKVNAIRAYGAQVQLCGSGSSESILKAGELSKENGFLMVPPFDHEDTMAGQGTVAIEILQQIPDAEMVFVPIGGGGLIAGVLVGIKSLRPDIRVIGVEPEGSNSMYRSWKAGGLTKLDHVKSIADGLLVDIPGSQTFPIVEKYVDDIILVNEEEIKIAMRYGLERYKLLCEPSGATSIAGAVKYAQGSMKKAVAIVSGGNLDLDRIKDYL